MFLLIFTDALLFCHLAICVCLWEFYLITFFVVILCKWRAVCEPVNTTSQGSSILIAHFRIPYLPTVSLPQAVFIVMCAASSFRICFYYCMQPTCHFLKICFVMGFPANVLYKAPCVKLLAIACMPCRRLHKLGDLKTIDVECFWMWDCTKMKRMVRLSVTWTETRFCCFFCQRFTICFTACNCKRLKRMWCCMVFWWENVFLLLQLLL